jgi:DNA (cytosine-5)-methyltransferase 1
VKYLSLFSGYGGFELGIQQAYEESLDNWRIASTSELATHPHQSNDNASDGDGWRSNPVCIGFSEIDKYAIQIYKKHFLYEECETCRLRRLQSDNSERPEELNNATNELEQRKYTNNCKCKHKEYGDITKIHPQDIPDFDLLVGGFPCQAFSIAGKRAGFEDTRGTLIYDVFRIIKEKHPKLVLLENVKGLLSHDNGRTFKTIITSLAELGYGVEWQVLNAKNFGVPQNRERVFIIGHLGGFGGRQVFPLGETNKSDIQQTKELPMQISNTLRTNYSNGFSNETYVLADEQDSQEGGDKPNNSNSIRRTPYTDGMRIRRLTPTECERLMGLPDGWTEGVSDTQRYKLCGNGVVVNVVKEIIKKLTL